MCTYFEWCLSSILRKISLKNDVRKLRIKILFDLNIIALKDFPQYFEGIMNIFANTNLLF